MGVYGGIYTKPGAGWGGEGSYDGRGGGGGGWEGVEEGERVGCTVQYISYKLVVSAS